MSLRHASVPESRHLPGMLRVVPRQADALAFGIAALVAVAIYGLVFSKLHAVTQADLSVDQALSRAHVSAVLDVARGIYWLLSPVQAVLLTAVLAALVWWRSRNLRVAITFAVVVALSWLTSDILKIVVHRHRPDANALAHPFLPTPVDPSFPSGHTVFAASLTMAFIFLARNKRFQGWVIAAGAVGTLSVAFAVLYLGVHYPSDVIGSIVWSVGASVLVLTLWNRYVIPRTYRTPANAEGL